LAKTSPDGGRLFEGRDPAGLNHRMVVPDGYTLREVLDKLVNIVANKRKVLGRSRNFAKYFTKLVRKLSETVFREFPVYNCSRYTFTVCPQISIILRLLPYLNKDNFISCVAISLK
jgi:hypothetical protein